MPTPLPLPWQIAIGTNGLPVPGARLYAYRTGSTTLQAIYADPGLTTALANPVVADAYGVFPVIYLDDRGQAYRLVLTDANGAVIPGRQADAVAAGGSGGGGGGTGENAFYVVLTRQTTTVPADSSGVVSSFSSANGQLRAYNGGTDITDLCALSVTQQANCTGTINTAIDTPVVGQPAGYYQVTAMSADVAELRMRATYGTRTAEQVFTLTKSKSGAQGTPGAPGGGGVNAITLTLSRDAVFAVALADGTVTTFTGVDGVARMFDGATDVTASTTWSASAASCTGTVNTATDTPVAGQPRGYYRVTAMTADVATLTIQGTYNSTTLNRVFTITKLKGGYEIVGTLPVTNLFAGRIVFLTTDNKLYRYTGSAWTTAVPAADITGLLADAQIAAIAAGKVTGLLTDSQIQAIAAAKLTGQIGSTQIADSAISTPKLSAGAVDASKIAAGSITGDRIAAGTITGNNILAVSITGDKMAANTIAGDRILANSITGDRLAASTITSDKIAAGQIVAAQIAVTELSAIAANMGTVTAGLLRNPGSTAQFDLNNGRIVFIAGSAMKVIGAGFGTSGQFLQWFGPRPSGDNPNLCSEATAVSYEKTNGSAYFGGTLVSGTITNSGQTTDTSASATITIGDFLTNGNLKTITLSYDWHRDNRADAGTGSISGTGTVSVLLEKSVNSGGAWTTLTTLNLTGSGQVIVDGDPGVKDVLIYNTSGSVTVTDNSAATPFMRLRATIIARTLPTFNGSNQTAANITQRVAIISSEP
jgi:hypothetical protein